MVREAERRLAADTWQLSELGGEIVDDGQRRESPAVRCLVLALGVRCYGQ
jgi:hypothetical protein